MNYIVAANAIVIIHFTFVCFVVGGGLLVLRWRRIAAIHIPSVIWAALIEFQGWVCPLTPLEQRLRIAANRSGYSGGFIEHYITGLLYPGHLDRRTQWVLGTLVVVVNLIIYMHLAARKS